MKIGLFFGTYNPIHVGHLVIANYLASHPHLDQVWLVVSPQNPLKDKTSLLADYHRLALVELAIEDNDKLRASDIEFKLSKPSYTVNTLSHLKEKFPEHEFSLIMGEDNLRNFHKWYNHDEILKNHQLFVYPRVFIEGEIRDPDSRAESLKLNPRVHFLPEVPVMNISASFIRMCIGNKTDVRYLLTPRVEAYIEEMHFYEK